MPPPRNSSSNVSSEESDCFARQLPNALHANNTAICQTDWDGISCWPAVSTGTTAHLPCFSELNGVKYNVSGIVTRDCLEDGNWSSWSNYRSCKPLELQDHEYIQVLWDTKDAATVYYVGYAISLVALTLALIIFIFFKELRCLRNSIHTNLMFTYMLIDVTWIITASLQSSRYDATNAAACFLVILLTYLMGTNFFWMFVEGLYLFVLVVRTFSVDNVKLRNYALIGWGVPAIVVTIWAAIKGKFEHLSTDPLIPMGCPWQIRDSFDYIFICPVVSVLLINVFFLSKIMWVLITKLRASNTMESQQYRKAAKALLVLIPLLGVTYILLLATPSGHTAEVIFTYVQAAMLSTQVQNSMRHHIARWRARNLVTGGDHSYLGLGGHSVRTDILAQSKARDSFASFSTSVSFVNFHSNPRSPLAMNEGTTSPPEEEPL